MTEPDPNTTRSEPAREVAPPLLRTLVRCELPDPSVEDLGERLEQRAQRHRELEVTGVVTFCAGYCLQLFEGEPAAVQASLADMQQQGRCGAVQVLLSTPGTHRLFPDWPLRLVFLSGPAAQHAVQAIAGLQHDARGAPRRLAETLVSAAYA
jgi:hypothetical protein